MTCPHVHSRLAHKLAHLEITKTLERQTPDQLRFWNLQFLIPSLLFTWIPPEFSAIHSNNRTLAT